MTLRATDIESVQFATTRMRIGYDMAEVDSFLDDVQATIAQLAHELAIAQEREAVLRTQCASLQSRVEYLEEHPEFRGDAASVMALAQATADEIIAAARTAATPPRSAA